MSVSRDIAQHIPYLRRFARALTGSREGGDGYVVATLETLIADPSKFEPGEDLRGALYRLFLDIWTAAPINAAGGAELLLDEAGAQRNLDAISLRPRIAFLLNALEGFDIDRIAAVLDVSQPDARQLIDVANREISDQIATDVLIIEDEPLIALDLRAIVEELGHRVIAVARTHKEAVAIIARQAPGLILADIQLADGSSGLEAVNEILASVSTPVIFVTAYPERFLTGEPPEPAFLLAKPFAVESLKAVVSQALFFDKKSRPKSADAADGRRAS
jgi:CheY-like chemotaxis protein